eukprot:TRINITY_DN1770_c0_g1_i5.p1 TRINITY_DN1770_c0_g1~~TRINITY_DN1770_c0_g1_i5.p1  ORF type:complete len:1288 (+),score=388.71 TRINITY_DN1770_c0_g1_i5:314-4177(+)
MLGAVVPKANLPNSDSPMVMDARILYQLYSGCFDTWEEFGTDEGVQRLNPNVDFNVTSNVSIISFLSYGTELVLASYARMRAWAIFHGLDVVPCGGERLKPKFHITSISEVEDIICETEGVAILDFLAHEPDRTSENCAGKDQIYPIHLEGRNGPIIASDETISGCFGSTSNVFDSDCWPFMVPLNIVFRKSYTYDEILEPGKCALLRRYVQFVYDRLKDGEIDMSNLEDTGFFFPNSDYREDMADRLNDIYCNGENVLNPSDNDYRMMFCVSGFVTIIAIIVGITYRKLRNMKDQLFKIHEEEKLHGSMRDNKIRLEESKRMMAFINHEIRNLLNGVLGLSLFARDTLTRTSPRQTAVELHKEITIAVKDINTVVQSCGLLNIIVNDAMKLIQLESGKLKTTKTPTNFCKLVNTLLKVFRPKFNEKPQIRVRAQMFVGAETKEFNVDSVHILQILSNLLSNAIKFTTKGTITVMVEHRAALGSVRFTVIDTGDGIPKDMQKSVFKESWVQEDTVKRFEGSGFGLYLCHGLATKILGGNIGFESVKGIGSEFYFEIPVDVIGDCEDSTELDEPLVSSFSQDTDDDQIKSNISHQSLGSSRGTRARKFQFRKPQMSVGIPDDNSNAFLRNNSRRNPFPYNSNVVVHSLGAGARRANSELNAITNGGLVMNGAKSHHRPARTSRYISSVQSMDSVSLGNDNDDVDTPGSPFASPLPSPQFNRSPIPRFTSNGSSKTLSTSSGPFVQYNFDTRMKQVGSSTANGNSVNASVNAPPSIISTVVSNLGGYHTANGIDPAIINCSNANANANANNGVRSFSSVKTGSYSANTGCSNRVLSLANHNNNNVDNCPDPDTAITFDSGAPPIMSSLSLFSGNYEANQEDDMINTESGRRRIIQVDSACLSSDEESNNNNIGGNNNHLKQPHHLSSRSQHQHQHQQQQNHSIGSVFISSSEESQQNQSTTITITNSESVIVDDDNTTDCCENSTNNISANETNSPIPTTPTKTTTAKIPRTKSFLTLSLPPSNSPEKEVLLLQQRLPQTLQPKASFRTSSLSTNSSTYKFPQVFGGGREDDPTKLSSGRGSSLGTSTSALYVPSTQLLGSERMDSTPNRTPRKLPSLQQKSQQIQTQTQSDSNNENILSSATITSSVGPLTRQSTPIVKGVLSGYTFLVVDDSPINRLVLKRSLTRVGGTVIEAEDGKIAIERYKENMEEIQLVWMDILMPEMDGLEACRGLRTLGFRNPIIACTGNVQERDIQSCMDAGMDHVEGKPLSPDWAVRISARFLGINGRH